MRVLIELWLLPAAVLAENPSIRGTNNVRRSLSNGVGDEEYSSVEFSSAIDEHDLLPRGLQGKRGPLEKISNDKLLVDFSLPDPTLTPTSAAPTTLSPSSEAPTDRPSIKQSAEPSSNPSIIPTLFPSAKPTSQPSRDPSVSPSVRPTSKPSSLPSAFPSPAPNASPSNVPSSSPSIGLSTEPSKSPTNQPTGMPSETPTTLEPSANPTVKPSFGPSSRPTPPPSSAPTSQPSESPTTLEPTTSQPTTASPSLNPTEAPSSSSPTLEPSSASPTTNEPTTASPTEAPSSSSPTLEPSSASPTTNEPTTSQPTTASPTQALSSSSPTLQPSSASPTTDEPTTPAPSISPVTPPSVSPTTAQPSASPTQAPVGVLKVEADTSAPTVISMTEKCAFCDGKQILDLDKALSQGLTCGSVKQIAGVVEATDTNCPLMLTAESVCCPAFRETTTPATKAENNVATTTVTIELAETTTASPTQAPSNASTEAPSSSSPTHEPSSASPTTNEPTTNDPTTFQPTTASPSLNPTEAPSSSSPTLEPSSASPTTNEPTTSQPTTASPSLNPTEAPSSSSPTLEPSSASPTTNEPTTSQPTTASPSLNPTEAPSSLSPTLEPTSASPTTNEPTTSQPTTATPTQAPSNASSLNPTEAPSSDDTRLDSTSGRSSANPTPTPLESAAITLPPKSPSAKPTPGPSTFYPSYSPTLAPMNIPPSSSLPPTSITMLPRMKLTLLDTQNVLSDDGLSNATLAIEAFLRNHMDQVYNDDGRSLSDYFADIKLVAVDKSASSNELVRHLRQSQSRLLNKKSQGTEIIYDGTVSFFDYAPTPSSIAKLVVAAITRQNDYLVTKIIATGHPELARVHTVYVERDGIENSDEVENLLPTLNNPNGISKSVEGETPGDSRVILYIMTAAGVATLTMLILAFTSRRQRQRNDRIVTFPGAMRTSDPTTTQYPPPTGDLSIVSSLTDICAQGYDDNIYTASVAKSSSGSDSISLGSNGDWLKAQLALHGSKSEAQGTVKACDASGEPGDGSTKFPISPRLCTADTQSNNISVVASSLYDTATEEEHVTSKTGGFPTFGNAPEVAVKQYEDDDISSSSNESVHSESTSGSQFIRDLVWLETKIAMDNTSKNTTYTEEL